MSAVNSFRDLRVWQEAHLLALEVYKETKRFPDDERYGLTSQMRRAAYSISANIAEGMGRNTRDTLLNFLSISKGSTQEMINFCLFTKDLGFLPQDKGEELIHRYGGLSAGIQKMISPLEKRPNKKKTKQLNN